MKVVKFNLYRFIALAVTMLIFLGLYLYINNVNSKIPEDALFVYKKAQTIIKEVTIWLLLKY
ncbi:hypothetical protein [Calorimonas adulescens]|uniref:Uncharacterized protein n=1 Tax=Calorimonas adulescens TaxID=2606906 RepID=A0A5D8QET7_9THEO|nr:hypothetical protein [Calorimonas adulescens]TZE82033.1 hypothetical protein FWJ32_07330 [Calorimonas adulescens]